MTELKAEVLAERRLNVMCVDDSALDLKLNQRTFKRSEVFGEVVTCTGAEMAMEYFRNPGHLPIDIIFLDVNMPLMNGFEFLEAATEEFGPKFVGGVVVMLTTSLNPKDRERAAEFEIVKDFLSKPLTLDCAMKVAGLVRDQVAG